MFGAHGLHGVKQGTKIILSLIIVKSFEKIFFQILPDGVITGGCVMAGVVGLKQGVVVATKIIENYKIFLI